MKLDQMRYLVEAAARNFNLSEVARAVHRSQSVISRQIQLLEEELGFEVLIRRGKRIVRLSRDGETVLAIARRVLTECDDLKRFSGDRSWRGRRKLTVATTHFHARYTLLDPILRFRKLHPEVLLSLKQCDPTDIERIIDAEEADLGITAQSSISHSDVISIPCQSVPRVVITAQRHPLLSAGRLTLERLAAYPLIVYDEKYSGGWSVMHAFQAKGLRPEVVLTAMDADVIKAYVAAGLGIAVVQSAVIDERRDASLRVLPAAHLFKPLVIVMMVKSRLYISETVLDFVRTVMPDRQIAMIESALRKQAAKSHAGRTDERPPAVSLADRGARI